MKAILVKEYGGPERLVYESHPMNKIGKDEVLIAVSYAGVNFPDTLIIRGKYQFQPDLPFSPGGEVSGIVEELGSDVTHLKVGDRVVAGTTWGGFAEKAISKGFNTFQVPDGVGLEVAAASLTVFGTVIHALKDRGALKKKEFLVVLGASGGTGSAAIQIGKYFGAEVIACASNEEKLSFCKKLGADHLLNYTKVDLKSALKEFGGIDVVFDPVGGPLSEMAFRSLRPFGRHLVVGFAAGQVPAVPWNLPLLKGASVVGVFFGGFWRNFPAKNRENMELLLDLLSNKSIDPNISQVFPLTEASKALEMIENRRVKGKLVLRVSD